MRRTTLSKNATLTKKESIIKEESAKDVLLMDMNNLVLEDDRLIINEDI
jgi:hypothetical protein